VKDKIVKDLMVPFSNYAAVYEDDTLFDAVLALEKTQQEFDPSTHRHRAILIIDKNDQVVGKISQWDFLKALEPKYQEMEDLEKISRTGFSPQFLKSMLDQHGLWAKPLVDVCKVAAKKKVKGLMSAPAKSEYINEDAPMGEAVHQLVIGNLISLLVVDNDKKIVGVLRLIDVFEEALQTMKACALTD
jgi:CBS domain-containing protein